MDELFNDMFGTTTDWEALNDAVLLTCCGDEVEWDCPTCPDCGAANPLFEMGLI